MLLSDDDQRLFYTLYRSFLQYVNERLNVVNNGRVSLKDVEHPRLLYPIREAFLDQRELLQEYVDKNPQDMSPDHLEIVRQWEHLVAGLFVFGKQLDEYGVFLSVQPDPIAYGVTAITTPFPVMFEGRPPSAYYALLLPFRGRIVYDGLLGIRDEELPEGVRQFLRDTLEQKLASHRVVTQLPASQAAGESKKRSRRSKTKVADRLPERVHEILDLVEQFCREHLNEEYAQLCREFTIELSRLKSSPLASGSPAAWASGIVRAIGWVNFLGDKTQTPHMRMSDIDAAFGVGESTGSAKLAVLRKRMRLIQCDPRWTLPSLLDENPLVWMVEINGFVMDIRSAPLTLQRSAFEMGLIPYIPAERDAKTTAQSGRKVKTAQATATLRAVVQNMQQESRLTQSNPPKQ